jgi:organic radical activating enzyme
MDFTPVLIGGEPFCNKNIFKYAEYIRSKDKNIPIVIFTNSKYLLTASDEIYKKLHTLKASLWITVYGLAGIDYNKIFQRCTANSVMYRINHYNENINILSVCKESLLRNQMGIYKLCENSPQKDNMLRKCMVPHMDDKPICVRVFNGILYYAACLPMLGDIDKKFNTDFKSKLIENEDYIYVKNITTSEISVKTIKFCKAHCVYCGKATWTRSDRNREEFLYET